MNIKEKIEQIFVDAKFEYRRDDFDEAVQKLLSLIDEEKGELINKIDNSLKECLCDGVTVCDFHNGAGKLLAISWEEWKQLKALVANSQEK